MNDRWKARNMMITGTTTSDDAAIYRLNCATCWERKNVKPIERV